MRACGWACERACKHVWALDSALPTAPDISALLNGSCEHLSQNDMIWLENWPKNDPHIISNTTRVKTKPADAPTSEQTLHDAYPHFCLMLTHTVCSSSYLPLAIYVSTTILMPAHMPTHISAHIYPHAYPHVYPHVYPRIRPYQSSSLPASACSS